MGDRYNLAIFEQRSLSESMMSKDGAKLILECCVDYITLILLPSLNIHIAISKIIG
ncbi:MAG: hypothetical protein KME32_15695 [Mojavia pulchra JT2-VF2]|jgi:hypothetical protein|uniref:Uncharacterized protein n=1 Tax=Mojavia pulchra JT2-VF2 TaxID=287848 RepID=A0A951Q1E8_9NOST|nr:hypothetical protein [Mojavia pulchra JT2-VF2]